MPPNKNTTLGALGRAVGAVVNSLNPLNETKALSQGLGLSTSETAALIKGQSDVVTYVSSVNASPSPAGDLRCFVDPATGQPLGLEQSGTAACSVASDVVVVPLSTGSYISQVKLAYTYDGAFVGRLVFELKADATAKAVSYTCGSARGKAFSLLPSDRDFVVTKVAVGCAPLPAIDGGNGGSGRRLQASLSLGLSAGSFGVTAAPLSVLPVDPATGIPRTPSLGDFLAPSPRFGRAPSAPTIGAVTSPESGQLVVPFAASADAGVPPVAEFAIRCLRGSALPSPTCSATGPGVYMQTLSAKASPLVATFASLPSDSYVCYAIANNGFDGDRCSAASATVAVVAPPSAPLVDTATSPNVGSIFVRFRASVDPGTPSVTNYAVRCVNASTTVTPTCASPGPSVVVPASAAALEATFTGLVGGTSYVCFVVANNGVAPGDVCSSASNAVTVMAVPPSAPAISSVSTTGVGALEVSFTASSNTGNPPVVQYVVKCVRLRSGGVVLPSCSDMSGAYTQPVSPAATPLQATFSSLPGSTYACFAIADNGFGGFTCSSASSLIGVTGPPTAPTMGVPTSPGVGRLVVPLTPSLELGFPSVADYTVKCLASSAPLSCSATGAGVYTQIVPASAAPLQANFTSLPGDLYACYVVAGNGVGPNQCSAVSANAVVPQMPTAPTIGTATSPAAGQIVVPFGASTSAGYPAVSTYVVRCVDTTTAGASCASTGPGVVNNSVPASSTPLRASLTGATGGASYVCYAVARNDALAGDVCSSASNVFTVTTRLPSAPAMGVPSSTGAGALVVPFTASTDAGVPPVANYVVKCLASSVASPSCGSTGAGVHVQTVTPTASQLSATFSNLPGGVYACYAIADNGLGGTTCSSSSPTTVVSSPPSAPTIDAAAAGGTAGTLVVLFSASNDTGTPPIADYRVRCVDTSTTATPTCASPGPSVVVPASAAAPLTGTLTGLVGGTSFVCFVVANNGVAPGDVCSSASNAVTIPLVPPSEPAISSVSSPGVGALDVSFTASSNTGNPPVVQYVVKCARLRSGGVVLPSCLATGTGVYTQPVSPAATPLQATFSSLPGDTYACFAIADNGFGGFTCSSASSLIGVTGPPNAPTMGAAAWSSSMELTVTFQASSR